MSDFKSVLKIIAAILAITSAIAAIAMLLNEDAFSMYAAIGCLSSAFLFAVIWAVMDNQYNILKNQDKLSLNQIKIYDLMDNLSDRLDSICPQETEEKKEITEE